MDFLAGFIDVNNIGVLNDASEKITVSFRQGPKYVESVNYIKHHDFYPIYCATVEQSIQLVRVYLDIAKGYEPTNNFDNDSWQQPIIQGIISMGKF